MVGKFIATASLLSLLSISIATNVSGASEAEFGPGDRKAGYDSTAYQTNSLSLETRTGQSADLLALIENPPLGLPTVPQPVANQATDAKIQLGRQLFYDRRLSFNDTFSCAICHIPEQGFTNNEIARSVGVEGRSGKRNSPTIYNVAYLQQLFHDGRESSLEQQAWSPLLAHNEMANPSIGHVVNKIKKIKDYEGLFEQAFEGQGPNMATIGMALAAYQRTLVSANSRFDRWYFGHEEDLLTEQEKKGFQLFTGKGQCSSCHLINEDFATFTDNQMHNTGMGYHTSMGEDVGSQKMLIAPGIYMEIHPEMVKSVTQEPRPNDLGLYEITQNPFDRWKYRTPPLRNVALTAPYMHNGSLHTLREVVEFYNRGGIANELLSPLVKPLNLSEEDIDALVSFMHTLTGDNVKVLVSDAFAAPIGDTKEHDPYWANTALADSRSE